MKKLNAYEIHRKEEEKEEEDSSNMRATNLVNDSSVCQAGCVMVTDRIPLSACHNDRSTTADDMANDSRPNSGNRASWQPRHSRDKLEEQENMTREARESQPQWQANAGRSNNTGPSSLFETSSQQPNVSKYSLSTNNNEHSRGQEQVKGNQQMQQEQQQQQQQRRRQQQLITRGGQQSKAAEVSWTAARLFSTLQFCLVVFVLSLFSSTTTTLVNGIKLQPEGKEKFYWSGEQFVITCQNNNNVKNVKIRWVGPDKEAITDNRKERIHVESNGHRLVVNNTQLGIDDGVYTCTINEGPRTRESADFILKVLKGTSFKTTAKHVTLKAGARSQVDCLVEFDQSVTTASVAWFKNQVPVDLLNDSSIRVLEYDQAHQVSSLVFMPVKREHEDEYTCQATAVTPNLSKIIDFKIEVETQYGPVFDSPEQTIWVESIQAINSRLHQSGGGSISGGGGQSIGSHQQQQQQPPATIPHRNMFGASNQRRGNRLRPNSQQEATQGDQQAVGGTALGHSAGEQVVRVELKCTCQANPEANILWFVANSNRNFAINRGSPEQVIEEPVQTRSGHNVTSTLVVAYNLDPNWEHRHEKYKCSASNLLDTAEKFYSIEQGNPPPAFAVGTHKSYSPETTVFNFTLLGPLTSGSSNGEQIIGSLANIMPPVDSFRIRAESGPVAPIITPMSPIAQHHTTANSINLLRRQSDQSVQWAYALGPETNLPLNMSVKLGNLPSGVQRLFLEAHNAVGHSPNATYLGEFNLVSSGFSSASLINLSGANLLILVAGQLFVLASYSMTRIPHS